MYDGDADPYCYPGTRILRNRLGIRDVAELEAFEAMITAQRGEETLPRGRLGYAHYRAIHRHLFQDVFSWAGRIRTRRIAKGDSVFCYPENIEVEMAKLFADLATTNFLRSHPLGFAKGAAHFLAELNAIHPFREGNGRTQLVFLTLLAERAGYDLAVERLEPATMLRAMVESFKGDEAPLAGLIAHLIAPEMRSEAAC